VRGSNDGHRRQRVAPPLAHDPGEDVFERGHINVSISGAPAHEKVF
jgi:hypothetical protein